MPSYSAVEEEEEEEEEEFILHNKEHKHNAQNN